MAIVVRRVKRGETYLLPKELHTQADRKTGFLHKISVPALFEQDAQR